MMEKKRVQVLIVLVVVVAAGLVAWYLFNQSNRLKEIQQSRISDEENRTAVEAQVGENATERTRPNATQDNRTAARRNQTLDNRTAREDSGDSRDKERLSEEIVTPYFVEDLAEFVVSSYHPPGSVNNKSDQGRNKISFKALNARYGLELIGLRHSSSTLQKARNEILQHAMHPERMKRIYEHYAGSFVQEVVRQAESGQKEFVTEEGGTVRQGMSRRQISEMLRLNSQYLQDVAQIFRAMSKVSGITGTIRSYLQAEQEAVHANYVLNRARNEHTFLLKKKRQKGSNATLEGKLSQVAGKKEKAARLYKKAIQKREELRNGIIETVRRETGPVELEDHEILYIAEWVYRRVKGGENRQAIRTASDLLADLSARFSRRAKKVSMESMRSS